ncbi:MAG: calcium/sodium antiporter [Candidatus Acidiferrales bacterium]
MLTSLLLVALGLVGLYFGAEWLVRGAARLAAALRVRPLFIGLTVVAFGTSAPEFVVTVVAAVQGNSAVALGNVLGSNIANVGLILGVTALIAPVKVSLQVVNRELPVMVAATLVFYALAWRLEIGRVTGAFFALSLIAFTWLALRWAQRESAAVADEFRAYEQKEGLLRGFKVARDVALIVVGLAALVSGGHALVVGAVDLARRASISDAVIAVSLVAVGTSLPELACSIVAALRKEADIVVGNLVGSNLFNILGALGLAAAVRPLAVEAALLRFDFIAMLIFSVAMAVVLRSGNVVSRVEGGALVLGYVGFVAALFLR